MARAKITCSPARLTTKRSQAMRDKVRGYQQLIRRALERIWRETRPKRARTRTVSVQEVVTASKNKLTAKIVRTYTTAATRSRPPPERPANAELSETEMRSVNAFANRFHFGCSQ